MALGVLSALHQRGVAVPGQISVIGYDDTYESAFFHPALTTVSLDLDLQGKEAVSRLLLASEEDDQRSSSILPAKLVVRSSTGSAGQQQRDLKQIAEQLRLIASRLE